MRQIYGTYDKPSRAQVTLHLLFVFIVSACVSTCCSGNDTKPTNYPSGQTNGHLMNFSEQISEKSRSQILLRQKRNSNAMRKRQSDLVVPSVATSVADFEPTEDIDPNDESSIGSAASSFDQPTSTGDSDSDSSESLDSEGVELEPEPKISNHRLDRGASFILTDQTTQRPRPAITRSTPFKPQNHQLVAPSASTRPHEPINLRTTTPVSVNELTNQRRRESTTFDLNLGPDRMIIKQPNGDSHSSADTVNYSSTGGYGDVLAATSSSSLEHLPLESSPSGDRVPLSGLDSIDNRRGLERLHPMQATPDRQVTGSISSLPFSSDQMLQGDLSGLQNICYTPVALLGVILITVTLTVAVCFCTHLLIRYLGRHQFDLIENRKHFDCNNTRSQLRQASTQNQKFDSLVGSKNAVAPLSLAFGNNEHQTDESLVKRLGHEFAFDNPYFRDTDQARIGNGHRMNSSDHQDTYRANGNVSSLGLLAEAPSRSTSSEENFIEHHISNLHNRQVTSSVNQLSTIANLSPAPANVVDLTSADQRAKILADPKEGDLVALDISGHDFIGLGFDVCGNSHEGIFIRSVQMRGPARESGCVERGDRIKCLSISFENMTLSDACDLLNCGSPYKMRLLLEKRVAPVDILAKMPTATGSIRVKDARSRYNIGQFKCQPPNDSNFAEHRAVSLTNSSGPVSTTRSYLKRLTKIVIPNQISVSNKGKHSYDSQQNLRPSGQTFGYQTSASNSSEHQLLSPTGYSSTISNEQIHTQGHTNAAYDSHYRQVDKIHTNPLGWRDVPTSDSRSPLSRDDSIEYQSKNARHKLHGPVYNITSIAQDSLRAKLNFNDQVPDDKSEPDKGLRQQSLALAGVSHQITQSTGFREIRGESSYLEHTQSQPEIATDLSASRQVDSAVRDLDKFGAHETSAMISSVSSPAVNLLPNSPRHPQDWRDSPTKLKLESCQHLNDQLINNTDHKATSRSENEPNVT